MNETDDGSLDEPRDTFQGVAFAVCYAQYSGVLYRYFLRRGAHESDCQDFVQDTFLAVYRHAEDFGGQSLPTAWIFKIAENRFRMHLRSCQTLKRHAETFSLDMQSDESPKVFAALAIADDCNCPFARCSRVEEIKWLRGALEKLPQRMKQALALQVAGFNYKEIAERLGVSAGTVRSQCFDARVKLREKLRLAAHSCPPE